METHHHRQQDPGSQDRQLPTRWENYLNGNTTGGLPGVKLISTSHSLGKLLEWKPGDSEFAIFVAMASHSLGKLLEWKRFNGGTIECSL